jgi:thymidine kinase
VEFAETLANRGVIVIVAMLNSNFKRSAFDPLVLGELVARSEKVKKLSAVCKHCGRSAAFSYRLTADTQLELIGGAESYQARCRRCFNQ